MRSLRSKPLVRRRCAATGPWASRAEPRCTGRELTRLIEPLVAMVAGLRHGGDVRFRQAAAIVLQHCADTRRGWWAGLGGSGPGSAAPAPKSSPPRSPCRSTRRCDRSSWPWPTSSADSGSRD